MAPADGPSELRPKTPRLRALPIYRTSAGMLVARMRLRLRLRQPPSACVATFVAVLGVLSAVGSAHAQCSFNAGLGKKLRIPLTRSFEECYTYAGNPNAVTEGGLDACDPVRAQPYGDLRCTATGDWCPAIGSQPVYCPVRSCFFYNHPYRGGESCTDNSDCFVYYPGDPGLVQGVCVDTPSNVCRPGGDITEYGFGPDGYCTLTASSDVAPDCSKLRGSNGVVMGLAAIPCHVTTVKAQCRDIRDESQLLIGPGEPFWYVAMLLRLTIDDPTAGDVTMIDLPVNFSFGDAEEGSLRMRTNTAEALSTVFGPAVAALPACTSLQIERILVRDPTGLTFASAGLATQP
jgi:hypothetical protein